MAIIGRPKKYNGFSLQENARKYLRLKNLLSRSYYLLPHAVWILRLGWSWYFLLHSKHNQSKCDFWCFKYIWQRLLPILPQPSPDVKERSPVVWEYFLYVPYIDSLSLSLDPSLFCFPVWKLQCQNCWKWWQEKGKTLPVGAVFWDDLV